MSCFCSVWLQVGKEWIVAGAERYDAVESDDEDEWVSGPGDDDDDKDDDKDDGSGDDKREMQQGETPNVDTSLRQRPPHFVQVCASIVEPSTPWREGVWK